MLGLAERAVAESANGPMVRHASVEHWVARLSEQIGKTAQSLVELGSLFIEAKKQLVHGGWQEMFQQGKLRFSLRTAEKLMQVAKNTALAKPPNSASLPASLDALVLLAPLDPEIVQGGIEVGLIQPCMTIKEAKEFSLGHQNLTRPEAVKPFVYDTALKALVAKVSRSLANAPAGDRERLVADLFEKIKQVADPVKQII